MRKYWITFTSNVSLLSSQNFEKRERQIMHRTIFINKRKANICHVCKPDADYKPFIFFFCFIFFLFIRHVLFNYFKRCLFSCFVFHFMPCLILVTAKRYHLNESISKPRLRTFFTFVDWKCVITTKNAGLCTRMSTKLIWF